MKKSILTLGLVCMVLAVLPGCGKTEPAAMETEVSEIATVQTTVPAETEETLETAETVETTAPVVDVNEALSNIWDIMDNECVEEIPILPGLLPDDIKDWMKETEYKEIKLYQRTDWTQVRLGTFGDMAVAQIAMVGDNITETEDFVWNVRMEKADRLENKTAIVIPEDASISETFVFDTNNQQVPGIYYFWENGDGTCTQLEIIYFEDTGNLYTFYNNKTVFTQVNGQWVSNSMRSASVVVSYIRADGNDYYDFVFEQDVQAARNKEKIWYFRIKTLDDERTYQYRFGMKLRDWVRSEYNTDGWKLSSEDSYYVVSPDNKFRLSADQYVWRVMHANLNGLKNAKEAMGGTP